MSLERAAGEGRGETERVVGVVRVEPQHTGATGGRPEGAVERRDVEAGPGGEGGARDAPHDLVADDDGKEKISTGFVTRLRQGERSRHGERVGAAPGGEVGVLETERHGPVGERGS